MIPVGYQVPRIAFDVVIDNVVPSISVIDAIVPLGLTAWLVWWDPILSWLQKNAFSYQDETHEHLDVSCLIGKAIVV